MGFSSSFNVSEGGKWLGREKVLRLSFKKKKQERLTLVDNHTSVNDQSFPRGFVVAQERIPETP